MTLYSLVTTRMNVICALCVLSIAFPMLASSQVQAISASGQYAFALGKHGTVEQAEGFGGSAELRLTIWESIAIGISGGYSRYAIEQPNALEQWVWRFWTDRYYPKIQSDMRADPNLSSQIGYVESMEAIPVMLSVIYSFTAGDDITVAPKIGGGVSFFTRKLYADETWIKQFPSAAYTLMYNLRNFAPEKEGNVFLGAVGCDFEYRLTSDLNLSAGVEYRTYLASSSGYEMFPFADEAAFKLGLSFLY